MRKLTTALLVASTLLSTHLSAADLTVAVEALPVTRGEVNAWVFAEGIAQGLRREYLSFESGGKVAFLATDDGGKPLRAGSQVRGPGDGSDKGQLLASIDERNDAASLITADEEVAAARLRIEQSDVSLKQARNDLSLARSDFARIESIYKKKLVPKKDYDTARNGLANAEQQVRASEVKRKTARSDLRAAQSRRGQAALALDKTSLFAPFDGVLRVVNIRPGDYWQGPSGGGTDRDREASAAMVVVDNSRFEVTLELPYYMADELAEGQNVWLARSAQLLTQATSTGFATSPNVVHGEVYSVSPSISLSKRAIEIKVHTDAGSDALRDGLLVTAWVRTEHKPDALILPQDALVMRDNKPYVYVIDTDNRASLTPLELGIEGLNHYEITGGLNEDDKVVGEGKHQLVNGTLVRVVEAN